MIKDLINVFDLLGYMRNCNSNVLKVAVSGGRSILITMKAAITVVGYILFAPVVFAIKALYGAFKEYKTTKY